MKLYLDTSTDTCVLRLSDKNNGADKNNNTSDEKTAAENIDREYTRVGRYDLAEKIFSFIHDKLRENGKDWSDISEITFYSGPGSFTGLRIGAALVNTLADQLEIPLYDHHGKRHKIILPDYGRPANISQPKPKTRQ